jgi:transketolase
MKINKKLENAFLSMELNSMSEKIAPRKVVGDTLVELAQTDPDICVLDADFNNCSITESFKEKVPDRFIQVGVAEQNMMGVAAGLATIGLKPFASTVAVFCSRRACDQVTTSIALQNLNVKILGVYPGLFVGKNGASHQSLEDIAIMRAIARMTVIHPADAWELIEVLKFAAEYKGPMYIRVARDPVPRYVPEDYRFELGKSTLLREGNDITIFTYGELIADTLEASTMLQEKGLQARVINMSSIKPIDEEAIIKAATETDGIITIDNHNIYGGMGSAVTEVVCENKPTRVKRIGVRDVFGRSGSDEEMKKKFGLRAEDIANQILQFLN